MPKDVAAANSSRRRAKEKKTGTTFTKRTPAQLAHLEDLVEEKKSGNLRGSFSVFEIVSDTQPRPVKPTVKRGGFASRKQQEQVQFDYGPASTGAFRTTIKGEDAIVFNKDESPSMNNYSTSSVPYIETDSIQSLYGIRPFSDFRGQSTLVQYNLSTHAPVQQGDSEGQLYLNHYLPLEISNPPIIPSPIQQVTLPVRPRALSDPAPQVFANFEDVQAPAVAVFKDSSSSTEDSLPETWKFASHSMVQGPRGSRLAQLEDTLSEDILVRAIMWGWESIGERWELPPFWQIIRQLDESMFLLFGPIERMAMFRIVHCLMRYHADPTPERAATVPSFYSRTIDFEGDYYIGNFLPWPGLRSVTKNPLHVCRSNKWFQAEVRSLKLLWPSQIQDCFTRSPSTGLFALTPEFEARTQDIHCWTFGPDMFEEFPQIWGMAPGNNMLPAGVGKGIGGAERKRPMQRCFDVPDGDDEGERDGIQKVWEEYSVDYDNLHWREEQREGQKVLYFTLW